MKLDMIATVAFAGLALFAGYGIRRIVPLLARYNVPAPVIGGVLVALGSMLMRANGGSTIAFDTALQTPLMIAFFTCIGFGASMSLLRKGGPRVLWFFLLSTGVAFLQNLVGIALAPLLGVHPLFGVLCGSVTLTGGPATGLAFAPLFEHAGVAAAASTATAAAMAGILAAGILGGPIGTAIIERHGLRRAAATSPHNARTVSPARPPWPLTELRDEAQDVDSFSSFLLIKHIVVILVTMWLGSLVSVWIARAGVTLPAYIGAMLAAALIRNIDDRTRIIGLSPRALDGLGGVALSLFITLALMTLDLWKLAGLALPILVLLAAQTAVIAALCLTVVFRWTGRDYDAAVISSGFCGFMLGITANAVANMESLTERYGPAPRAFLVVPMVGAFFIDFSNALVITAFLNLYR
jgi:glutamate:Na+ symporter, ESS family